MSPLQRTRLVEASVPRDATLREAASVFSRARISAIAVVDGDQRVAGLFTDDDLLRGLFPPYLEELRHTAFLVDDAQPLQANAAAIAGQTVDRYMREPATVEIDAAPAHVVERFLHTPWGAIAVVEGGRFVGMVGQLEFTGRLMERLALSGA